MNTNNQFATRLITVTILMFLFGAIALGFAKNPWIALPSCAILLALLFAGLPWIVEETN